MPGREIFNSPKEARVVIEQWRVQTTRCGRNRRWATGPPVPEAILPKQPGHGVMENAARFPHLHTSGGDYGKMFKEALH
jgi:hypothetical protein